MRDERELIEAARSGDLEGVKKLLGRGVPASARDFRGWSALLYASVAGKTEIAVELLKNGANPNEANDLGGTPLMGAASNDRFEIVGLLLSLDVDTKARDRDGMSALIFAAAGGNLRSTAILVEKGKADLEARDDRSLTPLMAAALGGYTEVVEYLLEHGADPSVTGRGGVTARSLAEERNYAPIVRMLDEHAKKAAAVDEPPAAGEAKVPTGSGKP